MYMYICYMDVVDIGGGILRDDIFYVRKINENWTKPFNITNTPGNSFIRKKYGFFSGKLLLAWSEELSESEYEIYYDEIETF